MNKWKLCVYLFISQGVIQKEIGSEKGPFTKIGALKTDPSQKSVA